MVICFEMMIITTLYMSVTKLFSWILGDSSMYGRYAALMENIILILCQTIFSLPFLMEKAEIIMNFYLDIFGWRHP